MDKIDKAILDSMQHDDTLSVAQVADKVAISKTACWRRIQKLVASNVINSRVALLTPAAVNLSLTVFIAIRTNKHNDEWVQEFRKVLDELPQILEVYRMSGDLDYLLKAVVSDMPDYDKLYKQLIKADIFDVSSSFVMEELKYRTQLPLDHI
ncbi:MAG: Lrp/AsnC family transcriptional regulator [Pseudomonadales bacterium]|nr:Lrp/AsnC family transcriptional regulator [Pseudomonadales bacterium]MCJ8339549.1 Lrp/AsnC family transcriptional regulator [Pseudomonadales bacterium]NRA17236.1 Lrp/AsnC family transcriptional regulator [Oceanospirillaceae bacterium]